MRYVLCLIFILFAAPCFGAPGMQGCNDISHSGGSCSPTGTLTGTAAEAWVYDNNENEDNLYTTVSGSYGKQIPPTSIGGLPAYDDELGGGGDYGAFIIMSQPSHITLSPNCTISVTVNGTLGGCSTNGELQIQVAGSTVYDNSSVPLDGEDHTYTYTIPSTTSHVSFDIDFIAPDPCDGANQAYIKAISVPHN